MSFDLTANDLLILEQLRLERLRAFFAETLLHCLMHLDRRNQLIIHCTTPALVDQLLAELDQLCDASRLILGTQHLSIRFAQEEIYRTAAPKTPKRSPQKWLRLRSSR